MEKALAVANEIINMAIAAGKPPTQMKLQKLIFFAHGWNLALYNEPLVDEAFQAWKYGPVLPSVYHEFKNFGVLGINRKGTEIVCNETFDISWVAPVLKNENTKALLQRIWEVFGKYTGTQLSAMTHAPATPWTEARKSFNEDARNIPINDAAIKDYFTKLIPQHE